MSQKLFVAIYENKPELALKLLKNGKIHSNINATFRAFGLDKPYTCLYWACGSDKNEKVVKEILKIKNIDANKGDDNDKDTPLHMAADNGCIDCTLHLFAHGINVTANSWGLTPLHCAASNGHFELLQIILNRDANLINSKTETNEIATPLHVAAMFGHIYCVRTLLRHGAKVDATDADKRTPANLALDNKHSDISILLSQLENCSFLTVDQIEHHVEAAQHHFMEPSLAPPAFAAMLDDMPGATTASRMFSLASHFSRLENPFGFMMDHEESDDDDDEKPPTKQPEKKEDKQTTTTGATSLIEDERAKAMAGKVRRNFINLKESLKADDHLEYLYEHNALTADDLEVILSKPDEINKAREMVFCMLKRPTPEWVYTFIESLERVPSASHWAVIISNP